MRNERLKGWKISVTHPLPFLLSQERLAQIEREKKEEEERKRAEAAAKREEIQRMEEEAANQRNMPVDYSNIVDKLFTGLPEVDETGDIDQGGCGTHTRIHAHTHSFTPLLPPPPSSPLHTHAHTQSSPSQFLNLRRTSQTTSLPSLRPPISKEHLLMRTSAGQSNSRYWHSRTSRRKWYV